MPDALDGDFSRSRAVLAGTWDYHHLRPVAAAEHSLDRMRAMLMSPLCGNWSESRISIVGNRATVGDLPHELVTSFKEVTDVALFYYVGHGQYDNDDRLCLSVTDSSADPVLRTTTSLTFDAVRHALRISRATTKIVILDCCFAGLAAGRDSTLAGLRAQELPRSPGFYLMMASSEFSTAWFQPATESPRPQTFFTKYLVDVIERGIPTQPLGLTLGPIFDQVADALIRDGKPEPGCRASDHAAHFVFARNAAAICPDRTAAGIPQPQYADQYTPAPPPSPPLANKTTPPRRRRRLTVTISVVVVVLLSVLVSFWIGLDKTGEISARAESAGSLAALDRYVTLRDKASSVITQLQKERDLAAVFVQNNRIGDQAAMRETFTSTDSALTDLTNSVGDPESVAGAPATAYRQAKENLNLLDPLRGQITGGGVEAPSVIARYTGLIEPMTVFENSLMRQLATPSLAGMPAALGELDVAREQVALQHAVIAVAIARSEMLPADADAVRATDARLSSSIDQLRASLDADQQARYAGFVTDQANNDRQRLKQAALSRVGSRGQLGLGAAKWDGAVNSVLEEMQTSETALREEITATSAAQQEAGHTTPPALTR